jgi:hypothetical protein
MASSIKLLITFLDQLVDVATDFIVNYVDTIGGIILTVIVIYGIKGFLAMLGD